MAKEIASEQVKDASTEEKILAAGKKIFTQKGYGATKIRDIAAEAGINLSLVNYYFRSKEKLFEQIMAENINKLFAKVGPIINNEQLSLIEKITVMAEHYIDLLLENPDFAYFIVNEVLSGSNKIPTVAAKKDMILNSHFAKQVFMLQMEGKIKFHPIHMMMNLLGMILSPFLGRKLFWQINAPMPGFTELMEERKRLIPVWIGAIISS